MSEVITLADPATSCDAVKSIANRIDALTLVLAAALESPHQTEATSAAPTVLALLRAELHSLQQRAEDAAEAIRRAA